MTPLLRTSTLIALAIIAFTATFSEPTSTQPLPWITCFIISKTIGLTSAFALFRLYRHWHPSPTR